MLCYFISKKDFAILNCVEVESISCAKNLDCGGKTKISIAGNPAASDEDFVIVKDGNKVVFQGIIEAIDNADGETKHSVSCLEIEQMFSRQIFLTDANIISATGIEDFIATAIQKNFSASGDDFIDMKYININVLTHTKVNAKPATESGIYNLKTYIGNAKQHYGIFIDFEFTKENLNITIHKKEQSPMQIDTAFTDVVSIKETYKVKVLSKLSVIWKNTTTNAETKRYFYLHSDRSVSEVNTDRIDGTISTKYIEAETEAEMIEAARNEFKNNSYSHAIEAQFIASSKIFPANELYVGHEVKIRTFAGVKDSIISEISTSDSSDVIAVKFGILKVTLTDKLK